MMDRVLTFTGKARRRGPNYVQDLLSYHAHAVRYRLMSLSRRANSRTTAALATFPAFHFTPDAVRAIVEVVPKSIRQATVRGAQNILEHRFSFRGLPEVCFSTAINWDLKPEGNLSWSWDLNRHRFFLTLGTAYHYTGDPVYKNKLIELWQDWMRCNAPGRGMNWRSPFEVAARLRNWMWAYFLLAASSEVSPLFLRHARRGLTQHAAYLADHLEFHWPNNHLLLEALSLYEFAVVFQGQGGERYLPLAGRVLSAQVQEQILRDGVHSELCPMYHDIVASELDAFTLLCRKLGHSLPLSMEERIFSMKRFSAALRRSDGSIPLLGDSSSPDTCFRFDPDPRTCSDLIYWLHSGLPPSVRTSASQRDLSLEIFSEGGYGIVRGAAQQTHLTFDFGAFSRCPAANHGHSDALSFEFHAAGRPWIVDSGFFHLWNSRKSDQQGTSSKDWSRYLRSTAAHNTVTIDEQEQNERSEDDDIGGQARVRLTNYTSNPNEVIIAAEAQPFWSQGEAVHQRRVSLSKSGELAVHDQVSGTRQRRLQWLLHFAPDLQVDLTDAYTVVARSSSAILTCELRSTGPAPRLRLVRGQTFPLQGWVAQSSARITPAWVLVADVEAALPYDLNFDIRIMTLNTSAMETAICVETHETESMEFAGVRS